jgi:hypothetical protein
VCSLGFSEDLTPLSLKHHLTYARPQGPVWWHVHAILVTLEEDQDSRLVWVKVGDSISKINLVWWPVPVVPATWEVEVGGSWFEASPGKIRARLYL